MSVFRQVANVPVAAVDNIIDALAVVAGELLAAPVSFINNGYASSISITSGADIHAKIILACCIVTGKQIGRASCRERVSSPV